jgi:8-oxo-dGTP pyrophosphatase MutT (NUDIX family)
LTDADRYRAPKWLADHAAKFVESGVQPAVPRPAATVILMRPASSGFEVYAMRRAASMAFAPGMYAFPGGSVDPSDSDAVIDWVGPPPTDWAARMHLDLGAAQAVVCAAVRELYEEAGVLLAGEGPEHVVTDLSGDRWETARADLVARRRSLTGWFAEAGLTLRADLLVPWARWLTPEFEPRRFDTFFFLARMPAEQHARDVGGEADHTVWVSPSEALELPMLPPTRHTLAELARYADIDTVLAAAATRDVSAPVRPVVEVDPDGAWLRLG